MNPHEIESTLTQLRTRHPNLDEAMLVTLLTSGGWEEKDIKEAFYLFKNKDTSAKETVQPEFFVPHTDYDHILLAHNPEDKVTVEDSPLPNPTNIEHVQEVKTEEPQSLITPIPSQNRFSSVKKESELPHDLPLRPFDTAPHVWPFSRYKDVFYGETMPVLSKDEHVLAEKQKVEHLHIERVPLAKKDEKLVIMACSMLLVIILLLVYMYTNDRL
jgi:hypothetical protein